MWTFHSCCMQGKHSIIEIQTASDSGFSIGRYSVCWECAWPDKSASGGRRIPVAPGKRSLFVCHPGRLPRPEWSWVLPLRDPFSVSLSCLGCFSRSNLTLLSVNSSLMTTGRPNPHSSLKQHRSVAICCPHLGSCGGGGSSGLGQAPSRSD